MTTVLAETEWVQNLASEFVIRFLARLSCEITIVGRNGYEAGTDELIKPRQLRRVNEVQNKVTACLSQLLEGECPDGFVESIAQRVLAEDDDELKCMLERSMASSEKVRSIEMTALGENGVSGQIMMFSQRQHAMLERPAENGQMRPFDKVA
ncbi:hypothetical protein [Duganella sp. Leaf61]|uniref:hypothetical protein n=1 Tax=Duganella sp. Leaf61 TaxID=1736227 RepID=UPI0012E1E07B|nr:hypothetical protein [Duganella sp. Leaf61]